MPKNTFLGFAFCIGISFGCANLALAEDNNWDSNNGPDGFTYLVHVRSSFGTKFDDCFAFDTNGVLTISGLGEPETFDHDALGTDDRDWQATSPASGSLGIAFHGSTKHDGNKINGNAINEFGDTFVFKGDRNDLCTDNLKTQSTNSNPYKR